MEQKTVVLGEETYKRLYNLVEWYSKAPKEFFGDYFHERVSDLATKLLPILPETDIAESHYFGYLPKIIDGKLWVELEPTCSEHEPIKVLLTGS